MPEEKLTQKERMEQGLLYDPASEEILKDQALLLDGLREFNALSSSQVAEKEAYMHRVFAECGKNCYIELPFHANFGGAHVHFGDDIYANFNLTMVDDGHIYVGNHSMFGPNVTVITAGHTINPKIRRNTQYNRDVHIGENVWIGACVTILPGVTIGDNSVIGAGSVVTKDIPSNVVAVGNPCRVLRPIDERDEKYFYRDSPIDWENIPE